MSALIVYGLGLILTVLCLELFKYRNRIWPVLLIISYFIPVCNLIVPVVMIFGSAFNVSDGTGVCMRDTKLNRWLFGGFVDDYFKL